MQAYGDSWHKDAVAREYPLGVAGGWQDDASPLAPPPPSNAVLVRLEAGSPCARIQALERALRNPFFGGGNEALFYKQYDNNIDKKRLNE